MVPEKRLLSNFEGIVSVKATMALEAIETFDCLLCTDIITVGEFEKTNYDYLLLVKKSEEKKPDFFVYSSDYFGMELNSGIFGYGGIDKSSIIERDVDELDFFSFMRRAESLIRKRYDYIGVIQVSDINIKDWDLHFSVYENDIRITDVKYKNNVKERFVNFLFTKSPTLDLSRLTIQEVPQEIYSLQGLRRLDLSYTRWKSVSLNFTENDSTFKDLEVLSLNDCLLDSFDADVSSLTKLQALDLSNNYIFTLHDSVFKLPNLEILKLRDTCLEKLPEDLSGLLNLRNFVLSRCFFRQLPDSIGELKELVVLHIDITYLTKLPDTIGNLKKMKLLSISQNGHLTELPESIGNMKMLERLYLYDNNLKVIPKSIGNLSNLRTLHLDRNSLRELPAEFTLMESLSEVNLKGNKLESLPDDIFKMPNLKYINIKDNPNLDVDAVKAKLMESERRFLIRIDS